MVDTVLSAKDRLKKERAQRIRLLRGHIGHSRKEFAEKYRHYDIAKGTLQSWEDGRFGGLTEDGAVKLAKAFKDEGLTCEAEWLLFGMGDNPLPLSRVYPEPIDKVKPNQPVDFSSAVTAELQLFHQHQVNALDCVVADDAMQPVFFPNDYVAASRHYGDEIQQLNDLPCVIQLTSGKTIVRILQCTDTNIILKPTNASAQIETISNTEIICAGPVIWLRRSSNFYK